MMSGEATPAQIGAFLMGLRVRGETVDEITGAVEVMRGKMLKVDAPDDAIDIVGTGGDGSGSYNISTAAAVVAAGGGLKIAKHGNRALSSKSAPPIHSPPSASTSKSARSRLPAASVRPAWDSCSRPAHHAAMKHVGPSRVELGIRTIFNLLGPLSNPAGVRRQLVGVFSREWLEPLAHVLHNLGAEHAWVTHGEGGLDEITSTGTTWVAELRDGRVRTFELSPEAAG